jgi:hypothetical protein
MATYNIPNELYERLQKKAEEYAITVNALAEIIIRKYVNNRRSEERSE